MSKENCSKAYGGWSFNFIAYTGPFSISKLYLSLSKYLPIIECKKDASCFNPFFKSDEYTYAFELLNSNFDILKNENMKNAAEMFLKSIDGKGASKSRNLSDTPPCVFQQSVLSDVCPLLSVWPVLRPVFIWAGETIASFPLVTTTARTILPNGCGDAANCWLRCDRYETEAIKHPTL